MNRRESILATGKLAGQLAVTPTVLSAFFQRCNQVHENSHEWTPDFIPIDHVKTLIKVIDQIIPKTDSPSASEAMIHVFIDLYVKDCLPESEQKEFLKGLTELNDSGFDQKSDVEQVKQLEELEQQNWNSSHFIRRIKPITLLGYFSSKEGAMQAAHYVPYHGAYEGCNPIDETQKVYAL